MLPSKAVQNNDAMTIIPIMQLFYTLFKTVISWNSLNETNKSYHESFLSFELENELVIELVMDLVEEFDSEFVILS